MKKIVRLKAIILTFLLVFINCSSIFADMKKEQDIQFEEFPNLNYGRNEATYFPKMFVCNNELYVTWDEYVTWNEDIDMPVHGMRIKKYDGSNWTNVDNDSLIYNDVTRTHTNPIVYNHELHVILEEYSNTKKINQIRIMKYNGEEWTEINNTSLNYDATKGQDFNFKVHNNESYIASPTCDENSTGQMQVLKYNDEKKLIYLGDTYSLNYNDSKTAYEPYAIVYNKELYLFWEEYDENDISQIRAKKYDGSKWIDLSDKSLNYDIYTHAYDINSVIYNDELYFLWSENKSIRLKKLINNTKGEGKIKY
ncbi:hypothetical protein [Tepidibacter hydrothermalis]|uniref:Uncharacterized protein n=1 Tax=Tepidibacter hydrothermalis TaxID=3036126 RepID=A0ABY8E750_9FIRM|nr:hypothetical protein [Tepidibacter hydrothermalis]WFD08723.1 hypothetical protein P4S50_09960 [Tepidibacter hydrothermalis]